MGDVVTLVEKAAKEVDEKEAKVLQEKFLKGRFTLLDYYKQLEQLTKMGGFEGILKYLPGMSGLKEKVEKSLENEDIFKKQKAMITSMTKKEKVIVAGAGGAAHLPGMVAALTTLPVIGVPVKSRALSGVDSLHSIVQMPGGIPVATVAIGGGLNAGLLAAQILSVADADLARKLEDYRSSLHDAVVAKDARLVDLGSKDYLSQMTS